MIILKDKQNKKKTCLLPLIILIIIILIIAIVPIFEKKQIEYLDYRCEISILGNGNYTLIIPAPIDNNGIGISKIRSPKNINGDVEISLIETKYGSGLIINGTSNSSFSIWHKKIDKNVKWDDSYEMDIDMFKEKPENDFNDDLKYSQQFEELLRRIFKIPKYKKPRLGRIPKLKSRDI